jgi:O-antigen ligase
VKIKINFDIISFFLISSFPILLISGPFLSDLFCILLSLIFIIYNLKYRKWLDFIKNNNFYFYFFFIFFIYLNVNSLFSFNPKISFASSFPFIRIVLFIFALSFFINNNKKTYKSIYVISAFSFFFLFIDTIAQYFFGLDIFGNAQANPNRISSFFRDELIMGSYVSRLLPIILGVSFLFKFEKKYFFNLIILSIAGVLVALSGERLAAFYFIGLFIVYFLLTKKHVLKFGTLIIIFLVASISYKPVIIDRFYKDTIRQINQTGSIFSYRHTLHYKTAYDMFLDEKILGHGLKSFRYKCSDQRYEKKIKEKQNLDLNNKNSGYIIEHKNGCNTHPHNIYFEFLSELGIVGIIFLLTMLFFTTYKLTYYSLKNVFKKKINEIEVGRSLILTGIFLQLFPMVPSGSYFTNWMMIIFHLSVGFYLSTLKLKND